MKLSPPKPKSAGLCEAQAVTREAMASTLIQMMVRT
jgi:hypothetical protein